MSSPRRFPIKTAAPLEKILLVNPPYPGGVGEIAGRWIPLGLLYLAGAARRAGVEADVCDAMARGLSWSQLERCLSRSGADYIAASSVTANIDAALKTLEMAKKTRPGCITILGGVHPTFMYEEVLGVSDAVDYVVIGEGEETLRCLLEVLRNNGEPRSIAGLAFRRDGGTVFTGHRPLIGDLDALPVAWDIPHWEDYSFLAIPGSRFATVGTSRGCDNGGACCSRQRLWGRSWRGREPLKVAEELEYLHRAFKVDVIMLADECPTRDGERWEGLLDAIIARKLPVRLLMESCGADILRDREILWKYRKAGIIYVSCGVETTGQVALALGRKPDSADMKQVFALLREQEIVSEGIFMLGLPDESPASVQKTMQLAQSVNPDIANFLPFTPWPYSGDAADGASCTRANDYRKYNMVDTVLKPRHMSMLQVDVALADCYRRFYMGKIIDFMTLKEGFRRDFLLGITRLFMTSSFVMKKLGTGIMGTIPAKINERTEHKKKGN